MWRCPTCHMQHVAWHCDEKMHGGESMYGNLSMVARHIQSLL